MDKQAGFFGDIVDWVGGLLGGDKKPEPAQPTAPAAPPAVPAVPAVPAQPATPPVAPQPAQPAVPQPVQPQPSAQDQIKESFKTYFRSQKPFGISYAAQGTPGDNDDAFNTAMTMLEQRIAAVYPPAANIVWDGNRPGTTVADVAKAVQLIGHIKAKGLQARTAQLASMAQGALMDANPVPKEGEGETPIAVLFTIPAGAANQPQHPYNTQQTGALQNLLPKKEKPCKAIQEKLKEAEEGPSEAKPEEAEGTIDGRIVELVKLILERREK